MAGAATLLLGLAACTGGGSAGSAAGSGSSAAPSASAPATDASTAAPTVPGQPFGTGCGTVPPTGPGSWAAMATAPVAAAAATHPELASTARAVTTANLADSLDSQQSVTVLAPVNAAWQAIPADQVNALMADMPRLTAVLTHHVLQGRLGPDKLAGEHTTLDNDAVTIEGSGQRFTISAAQTLSGKPATVVCGNVQTANATVYFIDQVLKPKTGG